MYQFELRPARSPRWVPFDKEVEKIFEGFNKTETFAPACEIIEDEKMYLISLDIPGLNEQEIDLEVKENGLIVSGERKAKEREKVTRSERRYGAFKRVFSLPQNVNSDLIQAKYENGVLEIILPKEEKAQTKKIAISGQTKNDSESSLKN